MQYFSLLEGNITTEIDAHHALKVGALLGEGPLWVDHALWFVDTVRQRIYSFDPETRSARFWETPELVGWILPTRRGGMMVGLQSGPYDFDPDTSEYRLVAAIEGHLPNSRLNDAAIDPAGRVWFGTMDTNATNETGRLYRWDGEKIVDVGAAPAVATNGPAISPDGALLYHVDSVGRRLIRYCVDSHGMLDRGEVFLRFDVSDGYPDGAICDAEGAVWICFYGGWVARRYAPDGKLTMQVNFPVSNVTKLALGGQDGCTAWVTTACQLLDEDQLAQQPLAGDLFTFRVDTPAIPTSRAR